MFEEAAARAGFALDGSQIAAAQRLVTLGEDLTRRRRLFGKRETPRGVYVWGPVGRGKSWLADVFYDKVPVRRKRRVHFHEFFREFHTAYARHPGDRGACDRAVAELLGDCRFLFFDEFHVHDPGDAMLIVRVLRSLFAREITLLATSNYPPAKLLPNPVFHHMFEPAIALLEEALDVVEVAGPVDYRAARRPAAPQVEFARGGYLWPGSEEQLSKAGLRPPEPAEAVDLTVRGRELSALAVRGDQVWFDFRQLCDTATSTLDYLTLVDRFENWVLSGLPRLGAGDRDASQRFANLVDVLCDRDVRFHLTGEAPLAECLSGEGLPLDINRTMSRLTLLPDLTSSDAPQAPTGA